MEFVDDFFFSKNDFVLLTEDCVASAWVDVLNHAFDIRIMMDKSLGKLFKAIVFRIGCDEHDHNLAAYKPDACHNFSECAFARFFVVDGNIFFDDKIFDDTQNFVVAFVLNMAAVELDDVMTALAIKSNFYLSFSVFADWKLRFVAVVIRILHPDNWHQFWIFDFADARKILSQNILFERKLFFVGKIHHGASTTNARELAAWLDSIFAWFFDVEQVADCVVFLGFCYFCQNDVACDCTIDKYGESIHFANCLALVSDVHNFYFVNFVFL